MRSSIFMLVALSLAPGGRSAAQNRDPLPPATRVRYTLSPGIQPVEADVLSRRGDSLWVRNVVRRDTVALALPTLSGLDIKAGRQGHAAQGAGLGLLSGVAFGAVLAVAGPADCTQVGTWRSCASRGRRVATFGISFGLLGTVIGAIAGEMNKTDRWEPVLLATD